jgi:hypothetical protein
MEVPPAPSSPPSPHLKSASLGRYGGCLSACQSTVAACTTAPAASAGGMYTDSMSCLKGKDLNTVELQMAVATPPGSTAQQVTPAGPRRRCGVEAAGEVVTLRDTGIGATGRESSVHLRLSLHGGLLASCAACVLPLCDSQAGCWLGRGGRHKVQLSSKGASEAVSSQMR